MPTLLETIIAGKPEHEQFYLDHGPDKHEQEDHYQEGISVVRMNVELLESWIESLENGSDLIEEYHSLPASERRSLWFASDFHYGIYGYDTDDADFWWSKQH